MDILMESVGDRIKHKRKEMQLTQTDIFEMCGIRSGALSRIENGTSVPSVILFYKIAQVLGCDMEWLLTGNFSNMKIPVFSKNEETLIDGFRKLSEEDQEEFLGILDVKLRKGKRATTNAKSSQSTDPEKNNIAG